MSRHSEVVAQVISDKTVLYIYLITYLKKGHRPCLCTVYYLSKIVTLKSHRFWTGTWWLLKLNKTNIVRRKSKLVSVKRLNVHLTADSQRDRLFIHFAGNAGINEFVLLFTLQFTLILGRFKLSTEQICLSKLPLRVTEQVIGRKNEKDIVEYESIYLMNGVRQINR